MSRAGGRTRTNRPLLRLDSPSLRGSVCAKAYALSANFSRVGFAHVLNVCDALAQTRSAPAVTQRRAVYCLMQSAMNWQHAAARGPVAAGVSKRSGSGNAEKVIADDALARVLGRGAAS